MQYYKKLNLLVGICCLGLLLSSGIAQARNFRGNFWESCRHCSIHGRTIHCACKDGHGYWNRTRYHVPMNCRFVENVYGQLQCTHWRHRHHHHW